MKIQVPNMQQTVHAFPLFATAQKPDARKSWKAARRLLRFRYTLCKINDTMINLTII